MALSITTIFGYGVGHVLNDLCSAMWFTYLLIYFHHVMQFNNQLAGVVLLIGQIADGLSTPFVGAEADRTDDTKFCIKYGRRKTWHLVGCICVVCAFPFIFIGCIGCGSASVLAQVIYFAPFVIIFQFGWAATQISHLSLIPSITQDVNDRTVLNAIRYAFTVISNITVYLITWLTLGLGARGGGDHSTIGPNDATSFRIIVSIVLGIGFVFAALFHLLVKEDNVAVYTALPESEDCLPHCRMSWKDWFNEPQFYQIAVLYMSTRLFCNITQAYIPIYLQDSLHLPENSVAYIPLVMYSSGFLTAIAMKPVNKHLGRKVTYIIGALIGFAGCVWVWFGDGPLYIHYLLYIVAVLIGSGGSTMLVTSLSFTADLIGPNIESGAFVYGAMSFTDKLSNGLAVILIQSYAPCFKNETVNPNLFLSCSQFYRNVLAFLCSGFAILGILATLSLLPKKVGQRHRNVTYSEHTSVYSEHKIPTSDSIKSSDSPEIKSISSDTYSGITCYGTIKDSDSPEDRVIYPESNGYGINSQVVASGISGSSSTSDRKVED
ncbi:unnamed protein product, partial [Meganyctiphanes norvegica]